MPIKSVMHASICAVVSRTHNRPSVQRVPRPGDAVIPSRLIDARIEALRAQRSDYASDHASIDRELHRVCFGTVSTWDLDFSQDDSELTRLEELRDEASGDGWADTVLISGQAFRAYAQEFAKVMHPSAHEGSGWPMACVNWDKAAEELSTDYHPVRFGDVTYFVIDTSY